MRIKGLRTLVVCCLCLYIFNFSNAEDKKKEEGKRATLTDLDALLDNYKNVEELLADGDGLNEYRDLLKSYMGYDDGFDPVFEETIKQMRVLVEKVPHFGGRLWINVAKDEKEIKIEAAGIKRSGIETKLDFLESRIAEQRKKYAADAQDILSLEQGEQKKKAREIAEALSKKMVEINSRYTKEIRKPSNSALKRFTKEEHEERRKYIQELKAFYKDNAELKTLMAYQKYIISGEEVWLDRYRSPFAEDSIQALENLHQLRNVETIKGVVSIHDDIVDELGRLGEDEILIEQKKEFESAKESMKKINKYEEAKTVGDKLRQYHEKIGIINKLKGAFVLPVEQDQEKYTLEIRSHNSKELSIKSVRAIHTAFAGRHTRECVGGAACSTLSPRRWALSVLKGVRSYFAEKGGVFDGTLRLVRVELPWGSGKTYDDVDIMIKSIDSVQEIKSKVTEQTAKYPTFDAVLDHLIPSEGSLGFVAGDGKAISQNTGLADVFQKSPSVFAADTLSKDGILVVEDRAMEKAIADLFPGNSFGYNPGGMIYEAMTGDGKIIYLLKPLSLRRKYTKEELVDLIMAAAYENKFRGSRNDLAKHEAWSLAVESDVKLPPLSYFQEMDKESLKKGAKAYLQKLADKGEVTELIRTNRGLQREPEEYGHLAGEIEAAIHRLIQVAAEKRDEEVFRSLATHDGEIFDFYPDTLNTLLREIEEHNLSRTYKHLAEKAPIVFKNGGQPLEDFINKLADRGEVTALRHLYKEGGAVLKDAHIRELYPRALVRAIQVAAKNKNSNGLLDIFENAQNIMNKYPEVLVALVESSTEHEIEPMLKKLRSKSHDLMDRHHTFVIEKLQQSAVGQRALARLARSPQVSTYFKACAAKLADF